MATLSGLVLAVGLLVGCVLFPAKPVTVRG